MEDQTGLNIPYEVLSNHMYISPLVIKHFIRFIISRDIYIPYVGRLYDSGLHDKTPVNQIINFSFTWDCYLDEFKSCFHFNNMMDKKWYKYHALWHEYCEKNF